MSGGFLEIINRYLWAFLTDKGIAGAPVCPEQLSNRRRSASDYAGIVFHLTYGVLERCRERPRAMCSPDDPTQTAMC